MNIYRLLHPEFSAGVLSFVYPARAVPALHIELNSFGILIALLVIMAAGALVYRIRGLIMSFIGPMLQGEIYEYRRQMAGTADRINNLFSLKEQSKELLKGIARATGCRTASLLFPGEAGDFTVRVSEPDVDGAPPFLKLKAGSPLLQCLADESKPIKQDAILSLLDSNGRWSEDSEFIKKAGIALVLPLVGRNRLVAVLALGEKQSGHYSPAETSFARDLAAHVAVAIERQYLNEQLREREKELATIHRAASLISSSLDIQSTFGESVLVLKDIVEIDWAAIVLLQENSLHFVASWSESDPIWQPGEVVPASGTLTDLILAKNEATYIPDLAVDSRAPVLRRFSERLRSVICLPLLPGGSKITGSLYIASRNPGVYSRQQISWLAQLASQIAIYVENARQFARSQEMARVDPLTSLLNRRSFDETLVNEIRRCSRYGGVFSIIIMDLDSFKAYNDTYGHVAGDKLLKQIGTRIRLSTRIVDYAFRYGGDEFAVLLPQTPINAATQVAERIRKKIVELGEGQSTLIHDAILVTASIGLAMWPSDGAGANEIIAVADDALYQAKRKGGNMVVSASGVKSHFGDVIAGLDAKDSRALGMIYALWTKLDAQVHDSHSEKVSEYAAALAQAVNMDPQEILKLETGALLHDIGKVAISNEILKKQGDLTPAEWDLIKTHPQLGANIANLCQLGDCVDAIRHHHEHYDGTGYPDGLKGEDIPFGARILAIADAFAAMTSERAYSNSLTRESALKEIRAGSGKQFDPHLAEVFISIFKDEDSESGVQHHILAKPSLEED